MLRSSSLRHTRNIVRQAAAVPSANKRLVHSLLPASSNTITTATTTINHTLSRPHIPSSTLHLHPQHSNFHITTTKMGVHNLQDKKSFDEAVGKQGSLMVLDCFATWCGPCKAISPKVVEFSEEFPKANFYKVDVDEVPDVAQELGIRAMPTFLLFKDGEKVGEIVGANPQALKAAIQNNYTE